VKINITALPLGLVPGSGLRVAAHPVSGEVTLNFEAQGSLQEQIRSTVALACKGFALEVKPDGETVERTGVFELGVDQQSIYEHSQQKVTIESGAVVLNGARFMVKGGIGNLFSLPEWNVELWTEGLQPAAAFDLFPMYFRSLRQDLLLEGPVAIRLKSSGTWESLNLEAQMDLEDLGLRYRETLQKAPGIPLLVEAICSKEGKRITIADLRCTVHQLRMNMSGEFLAEESPLLGLVFQTEPVPLAGWEALVPSVGPYAMEGSVFLRGSLKAASTMPRPIGRCLRIGSPSVYLLPEYRRLAPGHGPRSSRNSPWMASCGRGWPRSRFRERLRRERASFLPSL